MLSEGITQGTLVEWHVAVGQYVQAGDTIATIETDKAIMEVDAEIEGFVNTLFGEMDAELEVGADFYEICNELTEVGDAGDASGGVSEGPPTNEVTPNRTQQKGYGTRNLLRGGSDV